MVLEPRSITDTSFHGSLSHPDRGLHLADEKDAQELKNNSQHPDLQDPEEAKYVQSSRIAHHIAKKEDALVVLDNMALKLGVDTDRVVEDKSYGNKAPGESIREAREALYREADDTEMIAGLLDSILSEELVQFAARAAISQDKMGKFESFDLISHERERNNQGYINTINDRTGVIQQYPEVRDRIIELARTQPELVKRADNEGLDRFYEKLTGVTNTEVTQAYFQSSEALKEIDRELAQKPHSYQQRLKPGIKSLGDHFNILTAGREFKINKYITIPTAFGGFEQKAKYYFDGAPSNIYTPQQWLREMNSFYAETQQMLDQLHMPDLELIREESQAPALEAEPEVESQVKMTKPPFLPKHASKAEMAKHTQPPAKRKKILGIF